MEGGCYGNQMILALKGAFILQSHRDQRENITYYLLMKSWKFAISERTFRGQKLGKYE